MSDTNHMRKGFEMWATQIEHQLDITPNEECAQAYSNYTTSWAFSAWKAATERATALECERCAALVELRTGLLAMHSLQRLVMVAAADAIRQGGAS